MQEATAREVLGAREKAFAINQDGLRYGTFAEIGAGQEVVRWFFRAGGASRTIAKSMSAYDMLFSDAIYGRCGRYVSRERLQTMLDHEYGLLVERLDAQRGAETAFFAFADTVRAQAHQGNSECHGWLGVRFQTHPRAQPSQITIHVRMLDRENLAQQEALGVVGINLAYGAFYHHENPDLLLQGLLDNLSTDRIEVDMIHFNGPAFWGVDHRLMSLKLVQLGLSNAAMFSANGEILQPSEVLYKKPVLVERGSFRPVTHLHLDLIECARQQFVDSVEVKGEEPVVLMELTMHALQSTGPLEYADFLARADTLGATGANVLISNYLEYYRLAAYLRKLTTKPLGLAMGMPNLRSLFEEEFYEPLDGGILEAFGRLFKTGVRLFVYPFRESTGQLTTVQKLRVAPHLQNLYEHLCENGFVESIDYYNKDCLQIWAPDVLRMIREGNPGWERTVPPAVARIIRDRGLFGCPPIGAHRDDSGRLSGDPGRELPSMRSTLAMSSTR
jgi:hypothetical protein